MEIGTKSEMNQMDAIAIKAYGIPSILLMEHAAYGVFSALKAHKCKEIVIVCGPGNNGGDGFALAKQLVTWTDKSIKVIQATPASSLSHDGKVYYEICRGLEIAMIQIEDKVHVESILTNADIIVDALFGTGLTRQIEGELYDLIDKINYLSTGEVISIDIPSGICCDDGKVMGIAVKADQTFTFQIPKVGICIYPGILYAGKVEVVDIGIPRKYIENMKTKYQLLCEADIKLLTPPRPMRSHKGTYGKLLLIGGSEHMSGAITLATKAAMKAGAGTVTVALPKCIQDRVAINAIDAMTVGLPSEGGYFAPEAVAWIKDHIEAYDVIAIGPGMGRCVVTSNMVEAVLKTEKPCIIDADGLYDLKQYLHLIQSRRAPVLLTPHPKEFERVSGYMLEDIVTQPLKCVEDFMRFTGANVVLKLERSVIGTSEGIWINTTGNPSLAKGGSGDVLTGLIAGILAWSHCPQTSLCVGNYVHGAAADYLCHSKGVYTVLPSELFEGIERVFKQLEEK